MIKFELVKEQYREHPDRCITMPTRATKHSAGYDICTPIDFKLFKGETIKIKTDIKCKMDSDMVMLLFPRSSIGIKHGIILANTVGVIDADFYGNQENDGNITLALTKIDGAISEFKAGDKIAQAVFVKYHTDGETVETERKGGIGSTNG